MAEGQNCAVINPYALAELVAGERIPWKELPDVPRVLEQLLGTRYDQLFDPKFGGPLYLGHTLNRANELVRERSALLDLKDTLEGNDAQGGPDELADLGNLTLRDAIARPVFESILDSVIDCLDLTFHNRLTLTVELPRVVRTLMLGRTLGASVVRSIIHDAALEVTLAAGWTPPGGKWDTAGTFFRETAEFHDPVQGAVANCYYIAALSAIAWATPFRIAHQTRATGSAQDQFLDQIRFYKPDSGGVVDKEIQVTERLPLSSSGNFLYCRSSEAGEVWPAVYEKAFAKLVTGTFTDMPDILATGWGDCVWATAQLNGGTRSYFDTASRSADDLWNMLRSNCLSYRTFRPMTAWTYSTADAASAGVDYADAGVVGSHCYTVLGWAYRNCKRWIVLRNPWGFAEATASALDATISMYDVSWWRPITLRDTDGVFAMEIGAFKRYFAGFGVAA